jgi:hypothetical protein
MGSNQSLQHSDDETASLDCLQHINTLKQQILRKCHCYLASIEHTNSVVDIKLSKLREEISSLIIPLREIPVIQGLGMLGMAAILEDIEIFANTQKHAIQRLLDILHETQGTFEKITTTTLWPSSEGGAGDGNKEDQDIFLDEVCMNEIRLTIESLLQSYANELDELDLTEEIKNKRCSELERLLFKLGESTVSEAVNDFIYELKDAAIEEIDNDLTQDMLSGDFSNPEFVKATLQHIIIKSSITRDSLEQLPFSRRIELETAQEEIAAHVDQLIRRIQLNYIHSPEELAVVMNLQLPEDYEEDHDCGDPSCEHDQILIGNSDEDSDEFDQSTVVEQLEGNDEEDEVDDDEEDAAGAADLTEDEDKKTEQGDDDDEEEEEEETEKMEETNGKHQVATETEVGEVGDVDEVLAFAHNVRDSIENLKQALGPFSCSSLSSPSPYSSPLKRQTTEIVDVVIDLADDEQQPLTQEDQVEDPPILSQSHEEEQEGEGESRGRDDDVPSSTKRSRRKTVEMKGKSRNYSRIDPPSPTELRGSELEEESDAPSERSHNTRRRTATRATAGGLGGEESSSKRRRTAGTGGVAVEDEVSEGESVTSSMSGRRRQTRVMKGVRLG